MAGERLRSELAERTIGDRGIGARGFARSGAAGAEHGSRGDGARGLARRFRHDRDRFETTMHRTRAKPAKSVRILARALLLGASGGCASGGTGASPDPAPPAAAACFDRETQPHTSVVDAHVHFRPFNGPAVPFAELVGYLEDAGVRFATVMGIGQVLPASSSCNYYLDCPGTPVAPSFRNDFVNAANEAARPPGKVRLALAMTFPDLSRPGSVAQGIELLDAEFPGMFEWMGEVNLVKQAMSRNHVEDVSDTMPAHWAPFMAVLRERDMPLSIHADLGNNEEPLKHMPLLERVLGLYPENKIVWVHMGLSLELTEIDPALHAELLKRLLDQHPNLLLDVSWRIVHDHYFAHPEKRAPYIALFNAYSDRILPGTDFLASRTKDFETYKEELAVTSSINQYLSDEAFRNIALGRNYARLLNLDYEAPEICPG